MRNLLFSVLLLLGAGRAWASGTVTNCTEADLHVALRGGGFVTLACNDTISLTSTLVIAKETVLDGTGHTPSISGGQLTNNGPLFLVEPGVSLTLRNLTVTGARLVTTNTPPPGEDGLPAQGAAVYIDRGVALLDGCSFTNNLVTAGPGADASGTAATGGNGGQGAGAAIYNHGGQLTITNTLFSANTASGGKGGAGAPGSSGGNGGSGGRGGNGGPGAGAAICNAANGLISIYSSVFSSNQVTGSSAGLGGAGTGGLGFPGSAGGPGPAIGAAIFVESGEVTIVNSTFVGNSGSGATGTTGVNGGNSFQPTQGGKGGSALGAGLYNQGGMVALTNCTFVENVLSGGPGGSGGSGTTFGFGGAGAKGGAGGDALGAGLYTTSPGTSVVVNNTFTDNRVFGGAGGAGGAGIGLGKSGSTGNVGNQAGAAIFNDSGTVALRNSILANSAADGNAGGAIADEGFNLSTDATPSLSGQGSRNQVDPLLGSFTTAGGLVPTITLSSNSPAINAITAANDNGAPPFDQRNAMRVTPFDIGAFEFNATFSAPSLQAQLGTNQVLVSFPAAGNFVLQTTTNLVRTNSWITVTNASLASSPSGVTTVAVTPTNNAAFFRLRTP